jgi:hypothetical protein
VAEFESAPDGTAHISIPPSLLSKRPLSLPADSSTNNGEEAENVPDAASEAVSGVEPEPEKRPQQEQDQDETGQQQDHPPEVVLDEQDQMELEEALPVLHLLEEDLPDGLPREEEMEVSIDELLVENEDDPVQVSPTSSHRVHWCHLNMSST